MIDINERLIDAYKNFLDRRSVIAGQVKQERMAPYNWFKLQDKLSGFWMPYGTMLDEHCMGIANSINELLRYICDLEAWGGVIKDHDEDSKFEIIVEFISPIATLAINMPYVVRSRFIYSIVHLCHQCNRTKDANWVDKLPEENEIWMNMTGKHCSKWKEYAELKAALKKIANEQFNKDTNDFRNKYNHRYSLGIEFGITELVKRREDIGRINYTIGQTNPLKIAQLLPILNDQHNKCILAFKKYQELVNEQILAISA